MYSEDLFIRNFSNELSRRRKELSLSLNQLGDRSGVSASFILRIEKGERKNVSMEVIFKLANTLAIDVANLVDQSRMEQV